VTIQQGQRELTAVNSHTGTHLMYSDLVRP